MENTSASANQEILATAAFSSRYCHRPEPLPGPILVVVPHLRIGGAQKQAILLARRLKSSGHTVRIVLAGLERDRAGADYETLFQLGGFVRDDVLRTENRLISSPLLSFARTIRTVMRWYRLGSRASRRWFGRVGNWVRFREALQTLLTPIKLGLARAVNPISKSHLFRLFRSAKRSISIPWAALLPRRFRRTLDSLVKAHPELLTPLTNTHSLVLRAYYLQRLLRSQQPSVVFSFLTQTNLATLIATFGQNIPVVVSERNDLARQPIRPVLAKLRLVLYQGARVVTANAPHSVSTMAKLLPKQKVLLLANRFPSELKKRKHQSRQLGMLCRLEPQKNVDLVIRAFHNSGLGDEGWKLSIHGEGPESNSLLTLIQELSLQGCVTLEGKTFDPASALEKMDFLISASDYEGSSNVIHEAVAVGVIPLFAHTVSENKHILSKESLSKLMFHKSIMGLGNRFATLDQLSDNYEELVETVQRQFADYWDSSNETLCEVLVHAGVSHQCSQVDFYSLGRSPSSRQLDP